MSSRSKPKISVIVLNYNGQPWLQRCFSSIQAQTIVSEIELIIADNASRDGSDLMARQLIESSDKARFIPYSDNLGFCEGNNRAAELATGKYLFFLNNDTWLEPDCLEKLFAEVEAAGADAATPMVLDYDDNSFQNVGAAGLDWFGLTAHLKPLTETREIFAACGCSYLIRAEIFRKIGGFDAALFAYAEETDLSWRVWIAGGKIVGVPSARLHHRGAAQVNPEGQTKIVESRTSQSKRFLANRNGVLFILKNSQHILLLLLFPHLLLLLAEGVVGMIVLRSWSFFWKAHLLAIADCIRLRQDVKNWRSRIKGFRRRGDVWMMRFIKLKPNRFAEVEKLLKLGVPKVTPR